MPLVPGGGVIVEMDHVIRYVMRDLSPRLCGGLTVHTLWLSSRKQNSYVWLASETFRLTCIYICALYMCFFVYTCRLGFDTSSKLLAAYVVGIYIHVYMLQCGSALDS